MNEFVISKPKPEDTRNTEQGTDKDKILESGNEGASNELTKAKDFIRSIVTKRKLRLDMEAVGVHSAPTSPVANISELDLTWDEDAGRTVKKVKQDGYKVMEVVEDYDRSDSGARRLGTKIRNIIVNIEKEVKVASEWAKERNTKKELKEGVQKLRSLVSQLKTHEAQGLLQTLGRGTVLGQGSSPRPSEGMATDKFWEKEKMEDEIKEIKRINSGLEQENAKLRKEIEMLGEKEKLEEKMREVERENETLVEENNKLKEEIRQLQSAKKTVLDEEMLRDTENYDQFTILEKLTWPKGIYKSAFLAAGSPRTISKDADILVLHEEGGRKYVSEANEELERFFQERYPELKDLDGKVSAITINTRVIKPGVTADGSDKWVIRAELDLDEGGRGWFDTLLTIRKMMVDGGRKKLSLYSPSPDAEGNITRKIAEYIFRATGIKCLIYTGSQEREPKAQRTTGRKTDALLLNQAGKSYSELLKTLKNAVKPGTTPARAIRTIREARNGGMVVVLDKDTEAIEELRKEINKIEEVNMRKMTGNSDTTLFISDIDGIVDKEEIAKSIGEELKMTADSISVGEMRKFYGGNQTTAIRLSSDKAKQLLLKGRVRIGLSWCPVKERVEVTRCFRCWKYGHFARECKEETDGSKLCGKCGGSGHEARGCDKAEFCLTCKVAGHTAGSGRCPEFRKAIARERLKKKDRRRF